MLLLFLFAWPIRTKPKGSVISNQIGMKFGRNVLKVKASNDGVRFWFLHESFKIAVVMSLHAEKCCPWWVLMKSVWHICSNVQQFLICSTFVLVYILHVLRSDYNQCQRIWVVISSYMTVYGLYAPPQPLDCPNHLPVQHLPSVHSAVLLRPPGTLCQEQLLTTTH